MANPAQVKDAAHGGAAQNIYEFSALGIDRKTTVNLKEYQGKVAHRAGHMHLHCFKRIRSCRNSLTLLTQVLLIVNVASRCGYTSQYNGLEALYKKHKDSGLVVLGFPCDQFGHQEPGTEEQIKDFCTRTFNVTFPMFAKIDVNGPHAHPMWNWLKSYNSAAKPIEWNFTKFLVDKNGKVVQRFAPGDTPSDIEKHIAKLL